MISELQKASLALAEAQEIQQRKAIERAVRASIEQSDIIEALQQSSYPGEVSPDTTYGAADDWDGGTAYESDAIVNYGGYVWIADMDNTGVTPLADDPDGTWIIIGEHYPGDIDTPPVSTGYVIGYWRAGDIVASKPVGI